MSAVAVCGGASLDAGHWTRRDIVVEDGHVAALDGSTGGLPTVDATGFRIAPGYIDMQLNGAFGHDFTADPGSMWAVGARLPEYGVTAFLPTIISAPAAAVTAARAALHAGPPPGYTGAVPLGLHVEGPMLAPAHRGTHLSRYLVPAGVEHVAGLGRAGGVAMLTLAPELPGALAAVRVLVDAGVVVAAGHSGATFEEAIAAFDAGVSVVTHLFNGMAPFAHRAPGLAGAALATPGVVCGLIVDGHHVHPGAVALAWRAAGPGGVALVTDAIAAAGAGPGHWHLGDIDVEVRGGEARNAEGALAGSVLLQDQAVRNLVLFTGCPQAEAVAAASTTPARALGEGARGVLEAGARADLVLLDADLHVVATMLAGELVFDRRTA